MLTSIALSFFIGVLAVWLGLTTWFIVTPKTGRLIQRFGGDVTAEATEPGLHFKLPFPISIVSKGYELSQQTVKETIRIKTSDEVFLDLKITAFYERDADNLEKSVFNLSNYRDQMKQIMAQAAKERAPSMTVSELYTDKLSIQDEAIKMMADFFKPHGFKIIKIVVEDPVLDTAVEEASNKVYSAKRDLEAAKIEKQSILERELGEAEAASESLKLRTAAAGLSRKLYAKELAEAINTFTSTSGHQAEMLMQSLEGIDLRDAIVTSSNKKGNMTIVAMGTNQHMDMTQLPITSAVAKNAADVASSAHSESESKETKSEDSPEQ